MKLAEALALRADAQRRLQQLKARLLRNATVQEGEAPAEDPRGLLAEYEALANELVRLIVRINHTNALTPVAGRSMTEALAERDALKQRQALYRDLAEAGTVSQPVVTRSEVRFRSAVDVPALQKQADRLAKAGRSAGQVAARAGCAYPGGELAGGSARGVNAIDPIRAAHRRTGSGIFGSDEASVVGRRCERDPCQRGNAGAYRVSGAAPSAARLEPGMPSIVTSACGIVTVHDHALVAARRGWDRGFRRRRIAGVATSDASSVGSWRHPSGAGAAPMWSSTGNSPAPGR